MGEGAKWVWKGLWEKAITVNHFINGVNYQYHHGKAAPPDLLLGSGLGFAQFPCAAQPGNASAAPPKCHSTGDKGICPAAT